MNDSFRPVNPVKYDPVAPNSADRALPATPHSEQVKAAFNNVVAPVCVVGALVDGEPDGLVATSLSVGVSFDPPNELDACRVEG